MAALDRERSAHQKTREEREEVRRGTSATLTFLVLFLVAGWPRIPCIGGRTARLGSRWCMCIVRSCTGCTRTWGRGAPLVEFQEKGTTTCDGKYLVSPCLISRKVSSLFISSPLCLIRSASTPGQGPRALSPRWPRTPEGGPAEGPKSGQVCRDAPGTLPAENLAVREKKYRCLFISFGCRLLLKAGSGGILLSIPWRSRTSA